MRLVHGEAAEPPPPETPGAFLPRMNMPRIGAMDAREELAPLTGSGSPDFTLSAPWFTAARLLINDVQHPKGLAVMCAGPWLNSRKATQVP